MWIPSTMTMMDLAALSAQSVTMLNTMTSNKDRPFNPCAKPRPVAAAVVNNGPQQPPQEKENMGPQSQQRVNQTKRQCRAAASSKKKRKGDQITLAGDRAFAAERDCVVCHARHVRDTVVSTCRVPNRSHHVLCVKNRNTQGRGNLTEQNIANNVEEKRLKALFVAPLNPEEKASGHHLSTAAVQKFFAPKKKPPPPSSQQSAAATEKTTTTTTTAIDFGKSVANMLADASFREQHKNKSAPLGIIAFTDEAQDKFLGKKKDHESIDYHFKGLTMMVPPCDDFANENPHCHSIVGQELLLVDWMTVCGVQVPCPDAACTGSLKNDRSNFSKNKTLFPTFGLGGAPSWCMTQTMSCRCCKRVFRSNKAAVLLTLPAHISQLYPVETKCALRNHSCHLAREATDVLDDLMLTCANGELCSCLLCSAINRAYTRKIAAHCSYKRSHQKEPAAAAQPHVAKDGVFTRQCPPLGDTVRDMHDEASNTKNNCWQVSDHDRHAREIQSVTCEEGVFAQDHTFEVTKNCQPGLGAKAVWDVAASAGEIATAVCVPTTKTRHFSHAVNLLLLRPKFTPWSMCSDTWPHKKEHWERTIKNIKGRLGLFHFEKRMLHTLRKKHIDFHDAVKDLLDALCEFEASDCEKVLSALKEGTFGKKHTTTEIAQLQQTKHFRKRCKKHLRKRLREPNTMMQRLDDWFCKHKVTSSNPQDRPARGRLDPSHNTPLFTPETKPAVASCKEKAIHLADPMDIDQMCDKMLPNPNSKHQLTQHISKRGKSKLESFHDRLANFANSGMRNSLSDNLHLAGTARCNLGIRHKRSLLTLENPSERSRMPAAWERVVPHWNHSELMFINQMAVELGGTAPFPRAEPLPPDNGERFFSECMTTVNPMHQQHGNLHDECLCAICTKIYTDKHGDTTHLDKPPAGPAIGDHIAHKPAAVHQQQAHAVVPTNRTASMPTPQPTPQPTFCQQPFWQMPILPMPFFFMPPPPAACCAKCCNWKTSKRKGRPPHDHHCRNRGTSNFKCI